MYINFHQNRVSIDQSKPCTQSYLQKNRKLHKYATYNSNFETKLLSDMHHRITYLYINFQKIRISKNHAFRTCTTPLRTFMLILRSNRPVRYRNTAKRNYFHRRTDGRTDGRTNGQTARQTDRRTDRRRARQQ